ncbi:hypothetical protein M9Y85_00220 [Pseudomonas mosselii]|uniref:hypothetical protein n=1 Tax=Pseudomonas mosselii TaxID=78327 RepID=UPI002022BAD6|nr:hypothetical protein [Pseudomonas mosselii]MCL8337732.1 hypothetical protein [Pseudomonas mosselii]
MENWFRTFSTVYAGGVTAIAAIVALLLTLGTLLVLLREYRAKYRPYVFPHLKVDAAEIAPGDHGYVMAVAPRNIGSHPCYVKLIGCVLNVGDEVYTTPDMKDWVPIGTGNLGISYPIGHISQLGIENIRQGRYRSNRVEVGFTLVSKSFDHGFETSKKYSFDLEVRGENAHVTFRPE